MCPLPSWDIPYTTLPAKAHKHPCAFACDFLHPSEDALKTLFDPENPYDDRIEKMQDKEFHKILITLPDDFSSGCALMMAMLRRVASQHFDDHLAAWGLKRINSDQVRYSVCIGSPSPCSSARLIATIKLTFDFFRLSHCSKKCAQEIKLFWNSPRSVEIER